MFAVEVGVGFGVGVAIDAASDVAAGIDTALLVTGDSAPGPVTVLVVTVVLPLVLFALGLPESTAGTVNVPAGAVVGIEADVGWNDKIGLESAATTGVEAIVLAMSSGVAGVGTTAGGVKTDATDGGKGATVDGTGLMSALVNASETE